MAILSAAMGGFGVFSAIDSFTSPAIYIAIAAELHRLKAERRTEAKSRSGKFSLMLNSMVGSGVGA
jgi:hypothetical protein